MATTATLETCEVKGLEAPEDAGDSKTVVRYFRIHRNDYDALLPATGDTHSTETTQVVNRVSKRQPWGPTSPAVLMVVTYIKNKPTESVI